MKHPQYFNLGWVMIQTVPLPKKDVLLAILISYRWFLPEVPTKQSPKLCCLVP